MKMFKQGGILLTVLLVLLFGARTLALTDPFGQPQIGAVTGTVKVIENARIINFGKVIFQGRIDLNPTLDRIRAGQRLPHRNDGAIFKNREGQLPAQRDKNYYREFVLKMKGIPFPGPQRVIIGKRGEVFYTGDHYATFERVR
jgi:filamentous hemagglutinin